MMCVTAHAAKQDLTRGGLGFLFQDHNSFENPGQFSIDKGAGLEAMYMKGDLDAQAIVPSFVYGNGKFGLGVYGMRSGTSLSDSALKSDEIGAGVGFSMAKERVTVGIGAKRSLESNLTSDGEVGATVTINGAKRVGASIGAGFNTTINADGGDVREGKLAVGYAFNPMTSVEVVGTFNNLSDFNDWKVGGFLNYNGRIFYFSGGVNRYNTTEVNELLGRAGFVLGRVDLSLYAGYQLDQGTDPTIGGSFRFAF